MVNIKSFFLGGISFILLSIAFSSLMFGIFLTELPDNFDSLKEIIQTKMIDVINENFQEEINKFDGLDINLEELKVVCNNLEQIKELESIEGINYEELPIEEIPLNFSEIDAIENICKTMEENNVNNTEELKQILIKEMVGDAFDDPLEQLDQQIDAFSENKEMAFLLFIICVILAKVILFLCYMNLGTFIRKFSTQIVFVAIPLTAFLLILFLFGDDVILLLLEKGVINAQMGAETSEIIMNLANPMIEWFKGLLATPMAVGVVFTIIGIVGALTGFGIPEKIEPKQQKYERRNRGGL